MTEINGLINAMLAAGLHTPEPDQLEQAINKEKPLRWSTNGKKSDRAGFCFVRQTDQILFASFGCHRSSIKEKWSSKTRNDMPEVDWQAHLKHREELVKQFQEDAEFKASEAAVRAQTRWENAITAEASNPYLLAKNIQPYGLRAEGENLVIPCYRFDDETGSHTISTLQTVSPSGEKLFMSGGTKKGSFYEITSQSAPKDKLILCEGFATSASIFAATEISTVTCFDAGNLMHVAKTIRAKFPDLKIIVAADDDHLTIGNPGLTKATEAARAVGGYLAVPEFSGHERSDKHTDFNDLHKLIGLDAVRSGIEAASLISANAGSEWPELQPLISHTEAQAYPLDALPPGDGWPEPQPIPDDLPPVPAFDLDLLPKSLRPWIADIAERMQISPDIPAIGAVTALSAAIGRRVQIMPKAHDDWTVVPNLWGVVVAPPGYMKSPALSEVMKPLHRLEAEAFKAHQAAMSNYLKNKEEVSIRNSAAKSIALANLKKNPQAQMCQIESDPDVPIQKRYTVNNFSLEALGEVLLGNPDGVLAFSDEIHGLLMMAHKPGNEGLNDFLLSAWNGDGAHTFDRVGRGVRRVERCCVAVLGGIQPGRISEHVMGATSGGAGDSGLLQRFQLLTWPDIRNEWQLVDRLPDMKAREVANQVFDRATGVDTLNDPWGEQLDDVRRFDAAAQTSFFTWLAKLEAELRGNELPPVMASHLSKFRSLVPSLALVFAVADGVGGDVPLQYVEQAIGWADYLRPHAERAYACALRPDTRHARALLDKIKVGAVTRNFKLADVYWKGWSQLDRDGAVKAAEVLSDLGYLLRDEVRNPSGGRPSVSFHINPKALG